MEFGSFLLYASLGLSIFSCSALCLKEFKRNLSLAYAKWVKWAVRGTTGLLTISLLLLIYYFLVSDFSVYYVWQYSSRSLPAIYKISAFLIGHAGSMLFLSWTFFVITAWMSCREGLNDLLVRRSLIVLILVGFIFLIITLTSSPFKPIFDVQPGLSTPPADGLGMNPILRNIWMVFHPPGLFLGYGLIAVPFSASMVYMIWRFDSWERFSRPFSRLAWLSLSAGIVSGCMWSYEVWDGYWTWDPAFTSPMMVWLCFTAYLHASSAYKTKGKYRLLAPLLGIYSFVLALYSICIIKSGAIPSVHAFGEGTGFHPLLYIIFALIVVSIALVVYFNPIRKRGDKEPSIELNAVTFYAAIVLLLLLALMLAGGLSYVFLLQAFGTGVFVPTSFYNLWSYPLVLLLVATMGTYMLAGVVEIKNIARVLSMVAVSCIVLAFIEPTSRLYVNFAVPVLFFSASSVLYRVIRRGFNGGVRDKIRLNALNVTHIGIIILLIGVLMSSFTVTETVIFQSFGERKAVEDYEIELADLNYPVSVENADMNKKIGIYNIYKNEHLIGSGKATFEHNKNKDEYITRPLIYRGLLSDVQVTYQGIGTHSPVFISVATIKIVPGMTILWFGCLMTAMGVLPLFFDREDKRL